MVLFIFVGALLTCLVAAIVVFAITSQKKTQLSLEYKDDAETLEKYARDISWFRLLPKRVYYPRSVTEVVEIVKDAQARRTGWEPVALTVRAGGTCMSGGSLTKDTIIDMTKYMTKVSVDPVAKTATAEMGAYFRDIEDEAKKHGLMFAGYPSSHRICGIAGMIGNNASGEKSLRGGATGDNVISMEVVYADGTVHTIAEKELSLVSTKEEKDLLALTQTHSEKLRTLHSKIKKAAAGYRFDKVLRGNTFNAVPLFAGSQGTLGIITKATLKLVPIPEHTELLVVSATSLTELNEVVQSGLHHNAESLETFDKNTFAKAREHLSEHANRLLPYVKEGSELFILMQFSEATHEETHVVTEACFKELLAAGFHVSMIIDREDEASAWQVRRNSFLLMRDHNEEGHRAFPCIEDVIVPPASIGEFVTGLLPILEKRTKHYGFHGHIGDGSLRIVPVFDWRNGKPMDEIIGLMEDVFALVKSLGGSISADHSDGIIRTPFLESFYGKEIADVFKKIKDIYDPHNILNPGKKVGGTIADIEKYLQ
ncbi:MAG: FAD-binding oxidoreductase [Patescibacteria group bacterium]